MSDPTVDVIERKGKLIQSNQEGIASFGQMDYFNYTLRSDTGLKVLLSVRKPKSHNKPLPVVMLLGGHRTGRNAVRLIETEKPVIVAALSYPHDANPYAKGIDVYQYIPEYSKAFRDMAPAILLAFDFLAKQDYVDSSRMELAGISLGAFLVSVAASKDDRIRRLWLIHGAGESEKVINHNLRHRFPNDVVRDWTAKLLTMLCYGDYVSPEKWVQRISPRKLVVINARDDERLPASAVSTLHKALPDQTEIIWMEGKHVEPGRKDVINELTEMVFQRVVAE
ncbi:MAG: hypothetical protein OEZ33_06410 [Gammaproteobacteria bacterium]|nr:hypothetical protein [Gammaproteobacteria bacterium]MDH5777822.1 hypothetical protein [Gammaproteobacteria bacterium]